MITETKITDSIDLSKKIKITQCGENLENQSAYLGTNIVCDETSLNADNSAISLKESNLDLNGKSFLKNNAALKKLNREIFMSGSSKVYDSKKGAKISEFYNGIDIHGDNNEIHNLSIENTYYGISVNGHNNKITKLRLKILVALLIHKFP